MKSYLHFLLFPLFLLILFLVGKEEDSVQATAAPSEPVAAEAVAASVTPARELSRPLGRLSVPAVPLDSPKRQDAGN